ncbi:GTPase IMAP family member 4-like [Pungitius pungitius]|uniref:GTPase IMAP family member 4-like n=1 Tax=Pungitius pungitius TaxID=134920 RepID=UPI002E12CA3B
MSSISKQLSSISCAGKRPSSSSAEIRLVLLGETGSGKSSTANSILGRKVFDAKVSSSSVTRRCCAVSGEFRGRHLKILDTPGLLDTNQTPQEVQKELRRSVSLLYPGPHVFLLVIRIGRFTRGANEAVRQIKQAIGFHALNFSVVVFTHGDLLEERTSIKHCLIDVSKDLAELVGGCGGRYCVFNNQTYKKDQVSELLVLVDNMMQSNGGTCYGSKMLQKAEEDLTRELQEERRLLIGKEELYNKQEAAIREFYEKQLQMVQLKNKRETEELEKKQELEQQKGEKMANDLQEAFRQVVEDYDKKEKEGRIQEMVRVMEIRKEEEEKRASLQEALDKVTKTLEEQEEQVQRMRRAMEEKIQQDEKKEKERELLQIQKEQAIIQREEMRRDALEKELDEVTQCLEEQSTREGDRKKQMEDLLRREREERKREKEIQLENQRAENRRATALKHELKLARAEVAQHKVSEENLKRQLEEILQRERERKDTEMHTLKKQFDKKLCNKTTHKKPAERHGTMTTVAGYAHEMGLVGLNAALQTVRAPCCIQ